MIKHIVCWKLKDNAQGRTKFENAKLIKEKLSDLQERIKEIRKIEIGINSQMAPQDNYDVVLITEFDNFSDLDKYLKHPDHLKAADFLKELRETRVAIDFEI